MPPADRFVPRFAAEPPQEGLPYGRWADRLAEAFLAACAGVQPEDGEELGEPGDIAWHPDRTYEGRTYVPASASTSTGLELFGYVSFPRAVEGEEPDDLRATAELADLVVDQCPLADDRFTLIAPDDYRADYLEIALYDRGGREAARESLYEEDGED